MHAALLFVLLAASAAAEEPPPAEDPAVLGVRTGPNFGVLIAVDRKPIVLKYRPFPPPPHKTLQIGATVGAVGPRFVFPFPDNQVPVAAGFARLWYANNHLSLETAGWFGSGTRQTRGSTANLGIDFLTRRLRLGMEVQGWLITERHPLASPSELALDVSHYSHGITISVNLGHGPMSGSYFNAGPSATLAEPRNILDLKPSGADAARDDITNDMFAAVGGQVSGGLRTRRLHVHGRIDVMHPVGGVNGLGSGPFVSIRTWASVPLRHNWSLAVDAAYSSPNAFGLTPLNKRFGLGIGWGK